MKSNDYKIEDYSKALKEHHCISHCSSEAILKLHKGQLDEVEGNLKDALKSVATLQQLKKEKEMKDSMESLIINLRKMGIDVVVMQKRFGGSSL